MVCLNGCTYIVETALYCYFKNFHLTHHSPSDDAAGRIPHQETGQQP